MDKNILDDDSILTPESLYWHTFLRTLKGPEGIDLHFEGFTAKWHCSHHGFRPLTRKILDQYKDIDTDATLELFLELGGKCDCEVVFTVEDRFWKQMGGGDLLVKSIKKDTK